MKKTFIITCVALLVTTQVSACDICGCGVGGNYIGILPDFITKIIGIRYRHNSLRTHIGAGGTTTYLTTREAYHTAELWGGWNISKKIRVMAILPYGLNQRSNAEGTHRKNGLGDITLAGYYRLLNRKSTTGSKKILVQSLYVGGGIKLPAGKYNDDDKKNTTQNTNLFQLGTGSVDFLLNAMYDVRLMDAGLNLSASYKINCKNKYDYRYGNKLNSSAQAYYKFKIGKMMSIAPNAGLQYEYAGKDKDDHFNVDLSGGRLLTGTVGAEAVIKKVFVGAGYQVPLSQNLANGFVKANERVMVHIAFSF